jgi:predicted  nucleic acid-binding Zn-ribbon protein
MDQTIINWLFAGFGAAMGWILKVIWDAIRDLKYDLREIEKDLPEIYVRKDDFREAVSEIKVEMREMRHDMKISFQHMDTTLAAVFKRIEAKEDRAR